MSSNSDHAHHLHHVGNWMPSNHAAHKEWLGGIIDHVDNNKQKLHPVLEEFKTLIETNPRVYMLIEGMFKEVPNKEPYRKDPTGHPEIRDYHHFLQVLNHILTTAPSWTDKSHRVGLVGLPIAAILDWPMGTPSGFAAFQDPEINAMLKKVLNAWGEFLRSPASAKVLNSSSNGWFGKTGHRDLTAVAKVGPTIAENLEFQDMFHCDPAAPNFGFQSWDHFFTRTFREGMRPVAQPENSKVIANACESKPYRTAHNIHARDKFWLKSQNYSLSTCSIMIPFLSALSYHRWHAPVSGKVAKAFVVDGSYYSEPLFEGIGYSAAQNQDIDIGNQVTSQAYITSTQTRAVIFFEADEPAIGLMAFIGVGMAEVSTCEITVKEGQHVEKGDEIGMFHFGGSTHCLLFRKGVNVTGFPKPGMEHNVPVRSELAVVS
ncbi:hypothetical protein N7470_006888 [Penicillium chermesinum]|nr:hypothetical protein N7470_006888 [Penicillium chermesinum]